MGISKELQTKHSKSMEGSAPQAKEYTVIEEILICGQFENMITFSCCLDFER